MNILNCRVVQTDTEPFLGNGSLTTLEPFHANVNGLLVHLSWKAFSQVNIVIMSCTLGFPNPHNKISYNFNPL